MRRLVRSPVSRLHGHLHQLVGVQAALHHGLRTAAAAHSHAQLGGLDLGLGMDDRIRTDIDADLCGQSLHLVLVADQRGQDEALFGGFHSAPERHVGERPADRRGDGRQILAALQKLVKDMVVGGMADQRVNGNGFSQLRKIAHRYTLPARAADGCRASRIYCRPHRQERLCHGSQDGAVYRIVASGWGRTRGSGQLYELDLQIISAILLP